MPNSAGPCCAADQQPSLILHPSLIRNLHAPPAAARTPRTQLSVRLVLGLSRAGCSSSRSQTPRTLCQHQLAATQALVLRLSHRSEPHSPTHWQTSAREDRERARAGGTSVLSCPPALPLPSASAVGFDAFPRGKMRADGSSWRRCKTWRCVRARRVHHHHWLVPRA
eukprot:COSAG01_NODE_1255_length_11040_cov_67.549584_2_plen_167_part_00